MCIFSFFLAETEPQQNLFFVQSWATWSSERGWKQAETDSEVNSVGEGCRWFGRSIDCILALISIWLKLLSPQHRKRKKKSVGDRGIYPGGVRTHLLLLVLKSEQGVGGGGWRVGWETECCLWTGEFCADWMTLCRYSIQRSGQGPIAELCCMDKGRVCVTKRSGQG